MQVSAIAQAKPTKTRRGARLELRGLTKHYGGSRGVDNLTLEVPAGCFISLLGPSGSGKTTTLNLIAGFLTPDSGELLMDGRAVALVPPHKRNIGMVFQSYALFPHMTVAENIGYPLRMRGRISRQEQQSRIAETAEMMQISELVGRYPRQLSGGQQQRVAMARALVSHPPLLLMDEPLGALDKRLREDMQFEIKRIHRISGTTVVYVTHDQTEALTMSDLIVVMDKGHICQVGTPEALYYKPASRFVANFIGDSNSIAGHVTDVSVDSLGVRITGGQEIRLPCADAPALVGERIVFMVRPEDLSVELAGAGQATADRLAGRVLDISFQGGSYRLSVASGDEVISLRLPRVSVRGLEVGQDIFVRWQASAPLIFPDRQPPAGVVQ